MNITFKTPTNKFVDAVDKYLKDSKKNRGQYMKRQATLIGKTVVSITPPAGFYRTGEDDKPTMVKGTKAAEVGRAAITTDLMRIFYVMTPANLHQFQALYGDSHTSSFGHKGASPIGDVTEKILKSQSELEQWHKARRTANGRTLNVHRKVTTGIRFRDLKGLDMGIVTKEQFENYLKVVQKKVGYLVSGWEKTADKLGFKLQRWMKGHGASSSCIINETSNGISIKATNGAKFSGNVKDFKRRIQWAINTQEKKIRRQIAYYENSLIKKSKLGK